MAKNVVNGDDSNDSGPNFFPDKYLKALPAGYKDEADAMDEVALKKVIVDSEGNLYTIEKEKEADTKLTAAKELVKDLSGAYRDAAKTQNAKIKYALFVLESKGVDLDSTQE